MTPIAQKIVEMAKNFKADSSAGYTGELTPDNVYEYLYQNAVRTRENLTANNKLLNEWLYPMLKNAKRLTAEQADELFELSQELFQPAYSIDIELAASINSALVDYARAVEDEDFLIKSLYWSALSLHYMDKLLFHEEILSKFTEAASFRSHYKDIKSFETRKYINRSLGNIFVANAARKGTAGPQASLKAMDEARAFWENPDIRAFDPQMPWDSFIYSIHQNTCPMLMILRQDNAHYDGLAERVYESAVYLNEYAEKHYGGTQSAHVESRLEYYLICSKYHTGRISAREAGEKLIEIVRTVREGDYSLDAVSRMTHTSLAAFFYLSLDPNFNKDDLNRLKAEHYRRVVDYCAKIPHSEGQHTADAMIGEFISSISSDIDKDLFIDIILQLTIYRHLPTYVHSMMVSWLGELICEYLCDNNPGYLVGAAGTRTAEEVREKRGEIINCARVGGLCHDVGKIIYINIVATYGRKLSNREFAIIQCHPDKGYELLQNSEYKGIADIARGHHKWYDGSKGYPSDCDHRESEYRPITDIISVCNTIDTSTDILARAQAVGLTRREVVNQIKAMAGTKYAPEVAAALDDPALAEGIDRILAVKRGEAYCTAYRQLYYGK